MSGSGIQGPEQCAVLPAPGRRSMSPTATCMPITATPNGAHLFAPGAARGAAGQDRTAAIKHSGSGRFAEPAGDA